jgi:uncharacterized membrane protein
MGEISKQNDPASQLDEIKKLLEIISTKVDKQNTRIAALEKQAGQLEPAQAESHPSAVEEKSQPVNLPEAEKKNLESANTNEFSSVAPKPKPPMEFEERIGANLFAKIGIIALVLGVSFFLKYAFENNWINEAGRVIIGIVSGFVLLGIGGKTIRKYETYGQVVLGGGLTVLYLSVYAAFNFYSLISNVPAFIFMAMITAGGIALSLKYESVGLIGFSLIGGFATPFLISSGTNQQVQLFSYILILDLAIFFISYLRKWRELNLIGFIGTSLIYIYWYGNYYSEDQLLSTFVFLLLFFIIYSVSAVLFNLAKRENSSGAEQMLTLLTAASFFFAAYALLINEPDASKTILALLLAIYYLIWAYAVSQITADDKKLYAFLTFLAVAFVTVAIPIQFEKNIITLSWALEVLLLLYINTQTRNRISLLFGMAVYALVLFRLIFIDSQMRSAGEIFLINERFFTYLAVIGISYLAAFLMHASRNEVPENQKTDYQNSLTILIIAANLLAIFSVSREIVIFYEGQINKIEASQSDYYRSRIEQPYSAQKSYSSDMQQYQRNVDLIEKIRNKRDIALSLFWMAYAIVILGIGFVRKNKVVRIGGILLLLLAISKLFFYDLWSLGTLYRIISSISLGVVLLAISFTYQRYKDKIKGIIVE